MTLMLSRAGTSRVAPKDPARPLVLVVEEDARLGAFLDRALAGAGYRVRHANDGARGLHVFDAVTPDLVVVDMVLPAVGGLEVTRQVRAHSGVPIVMLGSEHGVYQRVAGLDAGADDFIGKPIAVEELLARIRAVLRGRALAAADALAATRHGVLSYADVRVDQDKRQAWRGSRPLELRNKAFELLAAFLRQPERVLSRRELLEQAWGYDFLGDSNVIEVTVGHMRQALEAGGEARLVHTVRPVGYILRAPTTTP